LFSFRSAQFQLLDLVMVLVIVGHTFTEYLYGIEICQPDYIVANWADVVGRMINH